MENSKKNDEPGSLKARAHECLMRLGIDVALIESRDLPLFDDADDLVIADVSRSGREHLLEPSAASAWRRLKAAAALDNVTLIIVSAFRSFERQEVLLQKKLDSGQTADQILCDSAPPGFSEHHSGRAIDIGTMGCEPVSLAFAETAAYGWLKINAQEFGFTLSYPLGNKAGIAYEPWHWCYVGDRSAV